jgi:hypothetical protein
MRYRGDRDTELINMKPMRPRFSALYIDPVFTSGVLKFVIRSSLSPVIFKAGAEYLSMVNAGSMIMPDLLLSYSDIRSNY